MDLFVEQGFFFGRGARAVTVKFSGRGKQPKTAESPEKAAELVAQNKGAIAIVPVGATGKGVTKIELK